MKTVNINKELNIKPVNNYKTYLNPEYLYIPIYDINYFKFKKNDIIYKGSIIYDDSKRIIYSPVSGTISNILLNKNKGYAIIHNDLKETSLTNGRSRRIKDIKKEVFLSYIKNNKLINILKNNINYLYINCIDVEPYFYNRYTYLKEDIKEILEVLDNIANILNIKKIILVVKEDYQDILNKYEFNIIETKTIEYKKINGIYPIGNDDLLKKYLIHNNNDNLINLDDVMEIIYDVKKNRPILEQYITINGNNTNNPIVLKIKKYTLIEDVLKYSNNYLNNQVYLINNSLYSKNIDIKNKVIDDVVKGIIINKNNDINELPCNNCGLCYNVCPYKINPLIKSNKCIKCGLCNYVCPNKINVVERYQK